MNGLLPTLNINRRAETELTALRRPALTSVRLYFGSSFVVT